MKISDIMHKGISAVGSTATLSAIAKTMKDSDIGAVPVTRSGKIVGIVTDRDLAVRGLANGKDISKLTAKDIMSKDVACCMESDTLEQAAQLMETNQVRRLPVLDEHEQVVGMVSLGDICRKASNAQIANVLHAVATHHP